jgi:trk system potassium uptake protein TrkH
MPYYRRAEFSPGRILILSFLFAIVSGTILLSLPAARTVPLRLIDIAFTAVSATCVTGLNVIPLSSFTFFGKCVILALIQIGGLGLMTLSLFLASLVLNLGVATRFMAGQLLEFEIWGKVKYFVALVVVLTFSAEALGTLLLYIKLPPIAGESRLFYAFFHSISAFCNAGISLSDNSLVHLKNYPFSLFTLSCLMFAGSIGFIVWYDIARLIKSWVGSIGKKKRVMPLTLHSKIAFYSSIVLIIGPGIMIFILEHAHLLAGLTPFEKVVNSFFTAISSRGVGFATLDFQKAHPATLLLCIPLMLIGASPGSTGSGIKTTTFVVFIAAIFSIVQNRASVEIWGRRIPINQIYKVLAIIALACFWIFTILFLLLLTDTHFSPIQLLFETVSAFGCSGISTGITSRLSLYGKLLLMLTMLIGRIGSLTLVIALRRQPEQHLYTYPEERIMIG